MFWIFFRFLSSSSFSSGVQISIKFETKILTLVLSSLRSKVRNAWIKIYHITSSEKFQGHWKWIQKRPSLYKWFRFEKCQWPEGEGGNAVGTKNLHPKAWHIFNHIPTLWNPPVHLPFIALNWQIEVTECLLSLGAEYFVLLFVFPPQKI